MNMSMNMDEEAVAAPGPQTSPPSRVVLPAASPHAAPAARKVPPPRRLPPKAKARPAPSGLIMTEYDEGGPRPPSPVHPPLPNPILGKVASPLGPATLDERSSSKGSNAASLPEGMMDEPRPVTPRATARPPSPLGVGPGARPASPLGRGPEKAFGPAEARPGTPGSSGSQDGRAAGSSRTRQTAAQPFPEETLGLTSADSNLYALPEATEEDEKSPKKLQKQTTIIVDSESAMLEHQETLGLGKITHKQRQRKRTICKRYMIMALVKVIEFLAYWFGDLVFDFNGDGKFDQEDVEHLLEIPTWKGRWQARMLGH